MNLVDDEMPVQLIVIGADWCVPLMLFGDAVESAGVGATAMKLIIELLDSLLLWIESAP